MDLRGQLVAAFNNAADAMTALGDRHLEERLHVIAKELAHPDTTEAELEALRTTLRGTD
jgi:hypothetical protein